MICDVEKDLSSFDLRVMQVLSILPLNDEQTMVRLNGGLGAPLNGLLIHPPRLNLHALKNKRVIGACNMKDTQIQDKNNTCSLKSLLMNEDLSAATLVFR